MGMRQFAVLGVAAMLLGGACGDDTYGGGASDDESVDAGTAGGTDAGDAGGAYDYGAGGATAADLDTGCEGVVEDGDRVAIEAVDFAFEPGCVEARADQTSDVVNAGDEVHNVTLERVLDDGTTEEVVDLGSIEPGENTAQEAFSGGGGPGTGTYRLYCKFHESLGMQSVIHVVDA